MKTRMGIVLVAAVLLAFFAAAPAMAHSTPTGRRTRRKHQLKVSITCPPTVSKTLLKEILPAARTTVRMAFIHLVTRRARRPFRLPCWHSEQRPVSGRCSLSHSLARRRPVDRQDPQQSPPAAASAPGAQSA